MRILVVDDDKAMTASLRRGLAYAGYEVDVAHSGATALVALRQSPPDAILLDWELPDISGIEVLRRLRQTLDVPVILLTAYGKSSDKVIGLDSGADDYLVKPCTLDELLARFRVLARRFVSTKGAMEFAGLKLNASTYEVHYQGTPIALVGKEFSILELLMLNQRKVINRAAFYDYVWEDNLDGGNSLEVHISNMRRKLNRAGAAGLLQTVRGAGYTLREPQPG